MNSAYTKIYFNEKYLRKYNFTTFFFLFYLRSYVLQTPGVRSLWDLGLDLFRQRLEVKYSSHFVCLSVCFAFCLSVRVFLCLSICPCVSLFVFLSVCLLFVSFFFCLLVGVSVYLSECLFVQLFVHVRVCVSCTSVYLYQMSLFFLHFHIC